MAAAAAGDAAAVVAAVVAAAAAAGEVDPQSLKLLQRNPFHRDAPRSLSSSEPAASLRHKLLALIANLHQRDVGEAGLPVLGDGVDDGVDRARMESTRRRPRA